MEFLLVNIQKFFSFAIPFILLLGPLIFIHELGHFLVAKFFRVRVETFSLGFGKKLISFKRGDTTYCLSLIPLGGYVKMFGDDPTAEISDEEKKYSFLHKPVWPRIAIVLAGPVMNLIFAVFLFTGVAMIGETVPSSTVGDVNEGTAAYTAGFRSGDTIVKINDKVIKNWLEVDKTIKTQANRELNFTVKSDSKEREILLSPKEVDNNSPLTTAVKVGAIDGLSYMSRAAVVGISDPLSPAGMAGFKPLVLIHSVNGTEISYRRQLENVLKTTDTSKPIQFDVSEFSHEADSPKKTITVEGFTANPETSIFSQMGFEDSSLFILRPRADSPAERAGLKAGDKLTAINSTPLKKWEDILGIVSSYKADSKPLNFHVLRHGQEKVLSITPEMTEVRTQDGNFTDRFTIGILPAIAQQPGPLVKLRYSNPFVALKQGIVKSYQWTGMIAVSFVKLLTNQVSAKNIGGIITIGKVAGDSFAIGIAPFLRIMAIISINLFLLNLLPVPVLDGGHLLFFTVEALRGAPMSMRKMEVAQQVGLFLLLFLMVFSIFNDITNLFISQW